MDSWNVANPGRKLYTEEELRLNPTKRDMAQGKTVAQEPRTVGEFVIRPQLS